MSKIKVAAYRLSPAALCQLMARVPSPRASSFSTSSGVITSPWRTTVSPRSTVSCTGCTRSRASRRARSVSTPLARTLGRT